MRVKGPKFQVVTAVIVTLVLIGFSRRQFERFIPAEPSNSLQGSSAPFLLAAEHQRIDWNQYGAEPFEEARRLGKPILFVVGAAWSALGRDFDRNVFSDVRIQKYLKRNYVCVRVDVMQMPIWINSFLPLSRVRYGFLPGLQAWILDSKGSGVDFIGQTAGDQKMDATSVLTALIRANEHVSSVASATAGPNQIAEDQRTDLGLIDSGNGVQLPDFDGYATLLAKESGGRWGGFPHKGLQALHPSAWSYLLLTGRTDDLDRSLQPPLRSPIVDWIDGGFFRMSTSEDWLHVQTDKLAVENAEMAQLLATAALVTKDSFERSIATATFDGIRSLFTVSGLVQTCREGDEQAFGRSRRSSFSPRQLRDVFPDDSDRSWAQDHLALTVAANPEMLPHVTNPSNLESDPRRLESILSMLRVSATDAEYPGSPSADVTGYVAARLIETARLWGDGDRLDYATGLFERLEPFRVESDIRHTLDPGRTTPYLGDYLGYADAALQDYLAWGRISSFDNGLKVLRHALVVFGGSKPGVFGLSSQADDTFGPQAGNPPEIVDNVGASCTSRLIRLLFGYARVLIGADAGGQSHFSNLGTQLALTASEASGRFVSIAADLGSSVAGYFCATAQIEDPDYAVTVGPRATELANRLFQRVPTRLIAPAYGSASGRKPGIYVSHRGNWTGPFTVEEATSRLHVFYDILARLP